MAQFHVNILFIPHFIIFNINCVSLCRRRCIKVWDPWNQIVKYSFLLVQFPTKSDTRIINIMSYHKHYFSPFLLPKELQFCTNKHTTNNICVIFWTPPYNKIWATTKFCIVCVYSDTERLNKLRKAGTTPTLKKYDTLDVH